MTINGNQQLVYQLISLPTCESFRVLWLKYFCLFIINNYYYCCCYCFTVGLQLHYLYHHEGLAMLKAKAKRQKQKCNFFFRIKSHFSCTCIYADKVFISILWAKQLSSRAAMLFWMSIEESNGKLLWHVIKKPPELTSTAFIARNVNRNISVSIYLPYRKNHLHTYLIS